jgi:D-arabinose 1-dehydrogenase-like Zn-dependent alcohol dehydrogenase
LSLSSSTGRDFPDRTKLQTRLHYWRRTIPSRVVRSVANLTRADGVEFLRLAAEVPVRTEVTPFPLEAANEALDWIRHSRGVGAAVVVP